jgi:hypothetical protein
MTHRAGEDNSLLWDIELRNVPDKILVLGEVGFPLLVTDDQGEYYNDLRTCGPFLPTRQRPR